MMNEIIGAGLALPSLKNGFTSQGEGKSSPTQSNIEVYTAPGRLETLTGTAHHSFIGNQDFMLSFLFMWNFCSNSELTCHIIWRHSLVAEIPFRLPSTTSPVPALATRKAVFIKRSTSVTI